MKPNKNAFRRVECPTCGGSGGGPERFRCPTCNGHGLVVDSEELDRAYDEYIDQQLDKMRGK